VPRGLRSIIRDGERILVDVTPDAGSASVNPPPLP